MFLFSFGQISPYHIGVRGSPNECVKEKHYSSRAKLGPMIRHISETVQERRLSYYYSHMGSRIRALHWYRNWWPSMFERRSDTGHYFALFHRNREIWGPVMSQWL